MITLQPFTPSDFVRLMGWTRSEKMLAQFAGPIFHYPLTEEQLYVYLAEPQRRAFTVLYQQRPVGHAEVMLSEDGVAKLCRLLIGEPEDRGKGLGEQMVRALIKLCWRKYNVREIELNVYDWNAGAIRCYEKVGFVQTSVNPSAQTDDKVWTVINMRLRR